MKTVSFRVSQEYVNKFLETLERFGYEPLCIAGCLQDNWIVNIGESNLKLGRYKFRKYVLIREVYLNEWNSGLELELTDDDSVHRVWMKHYENQFKEGEK